MLCQMVTLTLSYANHPKSPICTFWVFLYILGTAEAKVLKFIM